MAAVLKLWIYFILVASKCLHFVMSYMKQNKKKHKQTLKSAQYKLEIIFKQPPPLGINPRSWTNGASGLGVGN